MLAGELSDEGKMQRAVALKGIANSAEKLMDAGADTTEVQTFIHGAKRELAREMPNPKRMGEAAIASRQYQLQKQMGQR
jgi:hypothetical protein